MLNQSCSHFLAIMTTNSNAKSSCCHTFVHSKSAKFLKFFVLLVLGCINLCIDWFFYTRVDLIEPGLVYGPPNRKLKLTIFTFCVISSAGLVVEIIHNVDDISEKRKIRILSAQLTGFIDIAFTDLPMLILNLIITACHDGQPTLISVVKSSVCIVVIVVRFMIMTINKCAHFGSNKKRSSFMAVLETLTTIGLILALLISVKIQLLRIFPTRHDGFGFLRPDPLKFKSMDFIKQTYTNNVGIYAQWPLKSNYNQMLTNNSSSDNFIWITDVNDVIDQTYIEIQIETNFSRTYSAKNTYTTCFSKKHTKECFTMNTNSRYFERTRTAFNSSDLTEKFLLTLTKEPSQPYRYLAGYIDYNLNILSSNHTNDFNECTKGRLASVVYAYQIYPWTYRNYFRSTGEFFSFYNRKVDLNSVDEYWRTGVLACKMSGDLGPKYNERIRLKC